MKMESILKRILGVFLLLVGVLCVVAIVLYFSDFSPGGLLLKFGTPLIIIALVGYLSLKHGLRLIKAGSQETIDSGEDVHEGRPSIEIKTCPKCAGETQLEAIVCRSCGYQFSEEEITPGKQLYKEASETSSTKVALIENREKLRKMMINFNRMDFWGIILILIGIVLIIVFSWMAISNSNLILLIIVITLFPLITIVPGILLLDKAKTSSQEITKGKDS